MKSLMEQLSLLLPHHLGIQTKEVTINLLEDNVAMVFTLCRQ
jgi:hypothetical protein